MCLYSGISKNSQRLQAPSGIKYISSCTTALFCLECAPEGVLGPQRKIHVHLEWALGGEKIECGKNSFTGRMNFVNKIASLDPSISLVFKLLLESIQYNTSHNQEEHKLFF